MEEDGGAKAAPVTRLRRRLSVEQVDEAKSPAPATPTKKRGRLAAKPQLELIDEDAIQNSPKRSTRKSIARDLTEADDRPVTPSRRSARVKSNTSLVSEPDEKTLTPSRRSTRIKSNTSIVLETTQSVESPRAKRAVARRNSQAGSDNETAGTPARTMRTRRTSTSSIDKDATPSETTIVRTRRARKLSTSSIDKSVDVAQTDSKTLINDVISEEPETNLQKLSSNLETKSEKNDNGDNREESPSLRKSPRLMAKKGRKSSSINSDVSENNEDTNKINDEDKPSEKESTTSSATEEMQSLNNEHNKSSSEKDLLSVYSDLVKNLESVPKEKRSNKNKTLPVISLSHSDTKSKRHRTLSWTTACVTPPNEGNFYSDNESNKKRRQKHGKLFEDKRLLDTGSGDGPKNTTIKQDTDTEEVLNTTKKNRKSDLPSPAVGSKNQNSQPEVKTTNDLDSSNESNKENLDGTMPILKESSIEVISKTTEFGAIQSLMFLEDSDSNTGSINIQENEKKVNVGDQCVPVVMYSSVNQVTSEKSVFSTDGITEQLTSNVSCEPMDIDETLPNSFTEFTEENEINASTNKSKRKSSICNVLEKSYNSNKSPQITKDEKSFNKQSRKSSLSLPQEESPFKNKRKSAHSVSEIVETNTSVAASNTSISKQHRKSSLSMQEDSISKENLNESKRKSNSQHLEKSLNENKSTLVLSQIKDVSIAENSVSKSPQIANELSKSSVLEKEGPVNKNLTVNYSTSTPVQKKNVEKLAIQMNTSLITPTKEKQKNNSSKQNVSVDSKKSTNKSSDDETEESNDETSREKSNLFITEAVDAGDDYESGDSQDEDEREYEEENEIVERGETLTSEEEFSDDSDYEKDSFIVSSDEEDHELLSGSGDDLDMSDNELTMSAKSKKKFNDRKEKQQKKASKEMFDARHGSTKNDKIMNSKKKSRSRLDSTLLESGDVNKQVPPKKNKRMRLDSTLDSSQAKSDTEDINKDDNTDVPQEDSFVRKKKKTKLSESAQEKSNSDVVTKSNTHVSEKDSFVHKTTKVIPESAEDKSDSEDDNTKKNNTGISEEDSFVHKKKKTKRLSESMCNIDVHSEIEISINNKTVVEEDPLISAVKSEPKTPQKELEISTIQFTDRKEIEQVAVDENASMMKINETTDPLQGDIENSDDNSDDESISENEDITNNYESMLKELNKESKKQIKSNDMSLNLDKKAKKAKQTLVDELNLTQTKANKVHNSSQVNEKSVKRMIKKLANDEESSSDSIDLKLIFSDNSSEKSSNNEIGSEVESHFIPLKKSEAKTNIPGSKDDVVGAFHLSASKKNKRKSANSSTKDDGINNSVSEELPFYIDTKGDLSDDETTNVEIKKNFACNNNEDSDEGPAEVSYTSEKSKKRKNKLPANDDNNKSHKEEALVPPKTPETEKKNKKKKTKGLDDSVTDLNTVLLMPASQKEEAESQQSPKHIAPSEVSLIPTPGSKKKSKKVAKSQEVVQDIAEHEISIIKSPKSNEHSKMETNSNKKKVKSKLSLTENSLVDKHDETECSSRPHETESSNVEKSKDKKRKRKSSANKSTDEQTLESMHQDQCESQSGNEKKKVKTSNSVDDNDDQRLGSLVENSAEVVNSETHKKVENDKKPDSLKSGNNKRKERDDDESFKKPKVLKSNSFDKIHVPRLPDTLIQQLEDKPLKIRKNQKVKATSTTEFMVEEAITKRTKPSKFLEETVYLNDDEDQMTIKKKGAIKKPIVLPFLPTVSISDSGFTTNFQVNVISQKMEFVAKKSDMSNFKNEYLQDKRMKKMRTYDLYKKQRNMKLSKF